MENCPECENNILYNSLPINNAISGIKCNSKNCL